MSDYTPPGTAQPARRNGFVGYTVLDAVEMRIGQVTGCVRDTAGVPVLLSVGGRGRKATQYLVPLGYVIRLDAKRQRVQLRDLTRRRLAERCLRAEDGLPPEEVVESLVRDAPPVRPELLRALDEQDTRDVPPPRMRPEAPWQSISSLGTPTWEPLLAHEGVRLAG